MGAQASFRVKISLLEEIKFLQILTNRELSVLEYLENISVSLTSVSVLDPEGVLDGQVNSGSVMLAFPVFR